MHYFRTRIEVLWGKLGGDESSILASLDWFWGLPQRQEMVDRMKQYGDVRLALNDKWGELALQDMERFRRETKVFVGQVKPYYDRLEFSLEEVGWMPFEQLLNSNLLQYARKSKLNKEQIRVIAEEIPDLEVKKNNGDSTTYSIRLKPADEVLALYMQFLFES